MGNKFSSTSRSLLAFPIAVPQVGDLVERRSRVGGVGLVKSMKRKEATVEFNGALIQIDWWNLKLIHRAEGNVERTMSFEEWTNYMVKPKRKKEQQ